MFTIKFKQDTGRGNPGCIMNELKADTGAKMEKIDYAVECKLYRELKAAGEKITQSDFCKRRSEEIGKTVSLAYFKKKLFLMRQEEKLPPKKQKPKKTFKLNMVKTSITTILG